jgi:hypothetical protein
VNGAPDLDLSGRWTGLFNYPRGLPPVGFEADLREVGGCFTGTISEPDDDPQGTGRGLQAIVEGQRQDSAVTFAKIYEDAERRPEPVFYSGTLQSDGNEISGRWEIQGQWSGTFLMIREAGVAEAAEVEAGEEVPLPDG